MRFTRLLPRVTEARASAGVGVRVGSEQMNCLEETLCPAKLPAGCAEVFMDAAAVHTVLGCMCNAAAFETSVYSPE